MAAGQIKQARDSGVLIIRAESIRPPGLAIPLFAVSELNTLAIEREAGEVYAGIEG